MKFQNNKLYVQYTFGKVCVLRTYFYHFLPTLFMYYLLRNNIVKYIPIKLYLLQDKYKECIHHTPSYMMDDLKHTFFSLNCCVFE